jgi:hypothetical protein
LAIELAAARTRTLAPAIWCADWTTVCTPDRRPPDQRRSVTGHFGRPSVVLRPARARQQTLFQRLSVFAGPFDLDGAGSVVAGEMLDRATSMTCWRTWSRSRCSPSSPARSALVPAAGNHRRVCCRADCGSRLADLVAERHAQWCLTTGHRHPPPARRPAEIEGVARLGQLWPNLRAAFDWACTPGDISSQQHSSVRWLPS